MASALTTNDQWKAPIMVRALDPAIISVLWQAIYHLLPEPPEHPLGCHRPRVPDLVCFRGILIRLTTGSSWEDVEAIMEYKVSDTTLRARRDEWIAAGVFAELEAETRAGYDRIIGLDLEFVAIDGSIHKAPCGGEGTGKSPVDRAKLGHKWSVAADANGIPIGVAIDGANRNDLKLLEPTLDSIITNGLIDDVELLALDRGYDYPVVRERLAGYGPRPNSRSKNEVRSRRRGRRNASPSACDGSSKHSTHGGRTTANSDDQPTASWCIATPQSASPAPCS